MKLSLKTQTRMIYGLLLLCFVALGALAIDRMAAVSHESAVISKVWTPRSRTVEQLSDAAREYRIGEALRILSTTPDMATQADGQLSDNAGQIGSTLAAYRKQLRPGESTAGIDQVDALWRDYVSGNQQMLALAADNKQSDAADQFRNSESKFDLLSNALDDLSDYDVKQGDKASAAADEIYKQSRLVMIAALAFVAALLLASTLFLELRVWRVLVQLSGLMQRLARGDFAAEVGGIARRDEVGEMARAVQVFKDNGLEMQRLGREAETQTLAAREEERQRAEAQAVVEAERAFVVSSIAAALAELSSGDLTFRLNEEFPAEFSKLRADFNTAMEHLQQTMKVIAYGAVGIHSSTEEITQASDKLARRTEKQAASLEETAAALEQITATVRTSAESAKQAKQTVASTKAHAEHSGEVVGSAVAAMSEIERSARQISEIIGVMDEIAFQTNLLALNAGVEAARAGEAGKGFAVVATEVRALAQRSTVAAKEIKALISSSSEQVGAGVNLVGQTGKALEMIATQVAEINNAIGEIAAAADEQATGLLQINMSVSQMDKVTQQNAAMAEESTAASHTLAHEANELARLIGGFKLGDAPPQAGQQAAETTPVPAQRGAAILRTMSSGNTALAHTLETAIADDDWEEF